MSNEPVIVAFADCLHEAKSIFVQHHCRGCGAVFADGFWIPLPEVVLNERIRAVEKERDEWELVSAAMEATRDRLLAERDDAVANGKTVLAAWAAAGAPLLRAGLVPNGATQHQIARAIADLIARRDELVGELERYGDMMNGAVADVVSLRAEVEGMRVQLAKAVALRDDAIAERNEMRRELHEAVGALGEELGLVTMERNELRERAARFKEFAETEILDRVSEQLGVDLRRQFDDVGSGPEEGS